MGIVTSLSLEQVSEVIDGVIFEKLLTVPLFNVFQGAHLSDIAAPSSLIAKFEIKALS